MNFHPAVAFCFYNLSSIVNGLIYFNQFSLLSTTHLLLVMLGIVILLAGVWIVSFPPGGSHRIDLSHWDESEGEEDEEEFIRYEDEPLPMASAVHPDEEIGMGRVSTSRERPVAHPALLVDLGSDDEGEHRTATTEPPMESPVHLSPRSDRHDKPHARRKTDSALLSSQYGVAPTLSPTQPSHPLQQSPSRARHRSTLANHATLGPLSPRQGHNPHTHPLSPGAPSGFSIGLSPISPGFSLVPADRIPKRRRVTSLSSLDGVADVFSGGAHTRPGRRVISDVSRDSVARSEAEHGERVDVEAQHGHVDESREPHNEGQRGARGRWKWISGILASKQQR